MSAVWLMPSDLAPFAVIDEAKALLMIEDALALAERVAPCITSPTFAYSLAAKAVLRAVILRWNESGTGAVQTERVDDYSYTNDTRAQSRRGLFWPSEIQQLQELCSTGAPTGAFGIDTVGQLGSAHADICALNFGALYCSCGAVLTQNLPLYENL